MPLPTETVLSDDTKKEYPALKPGTYQVEIVDILDKKKPPYNEPSAPATEQFMAFSFAVLNPDKDIRNRRLWSKDMRPHKPIKGNDIYDIVCATLNKELTPEEGMKFSATDLNSLIGKQMVVMVNRHYGKIKTDKQYNDIVNYMPIESELPPLTSEETKPRDKPVTGGTAPAEDVNVDSIPF